MLYALIALAVVVLTYEASALWVTDKIPTLTIIFQVVVRHFSPACHDLDLLSKRLIAQWQLEREERLSAEVGALSPLAGLQRRAPDLLGVEYATCSSQEFAAIEDLYWKANRFPQMSQELADRGIQNVLCFGVYWTPAS
jgi:hypothetical protein